MAILIAFAFVAGVATVISPCIIPILPVVLASGLAGGKSRPFGVVLGLVVSFSFFTLLLSTIIHATGISPDWLRYAAIGTLLFFGCVTFSSKLSDWFSRLTQPVAQIGNRADARLSSNAWSNGFAGGLLLGTILGLLWTPCAGPILASITALAATRNLNSQAIVLTAAYALGFGVPMLLIAYGGQHFVTTSRFFSRHAGGFRRAFGIIMILTAVGIATHADAQLQIMLSRYFPNLTPDNNKSVIHALGPSDESGERIDGANESNKGSAPSRSEQIPAVSTLPKIAVAPEFAGISNWLNSPPLTLNGLRGKVVLIDFWTYSCINCLRTLPYLSGWYQKYKNKGFTIIGVHTPEFEFEKSAENVAAAAKRLGIQYPVALDSAYETWGAYNNHYWPAHYLIDQDGFVRSVHFGEGKYVETENEIRALLKETPLESSREEMNRGLWELPLTPETYLGYGRATSYVGDIKLEPDKDKMYGNTQFPGADKVSLRGHWLADEEFIEAREDGAELFLNFSARSVYLVLAAPLSQPAVLAVHVDGKELAATERTHDMNAQGKVLVSEPRKYDIVKLARPGERHTLALTFARGLRAYAFTFGNE
jgi:cytochrome c biogenesis protein CcdA/thiol-disulfide isomerase/thioredoxin